MKNTFKAVLLFIFALPSYALASTNQAEPKAQHLSNQQLLIIQEALLKAQQQNAFSEDEQAALQAYITAQSKKRLTIGLYIAAGVGALALLVWAVYQLTKTNEIATVDQTTAGTPAATSWAVHIPASELPGNPRYNLIGRDLQVNENRHGDLTIRGSSASNGIVLLRGDNGNQIAIQNGEILPNERITEAVRRAMIDGNGNHMITVHGRGNQVAVGNNVTASTWRIGWFGN